MLNGRHILCPKLPGHIWILTVICDAEDTDRNLLVVAEGSGRISEYAPYLTRSYGKSNLFGLRRTSTVSGNCPLTP